MTRRQALRLLVLVTLVAGIALLQFLPIRDMLDAVTAFEARSPLLAAIVYVSLAVLMIALMSPGWVIMMMAGLMFGVVQGVALATIAITLGALASFFVGRTLARDWVRTRISGNARLEALDHAIENRSFRIVFLTRVALVLPFNLLNYVYGATRVSARTYAAATAVGMLPPIALYVYLGSLNDDIAQILSRERSLDASSWVAIGVAIIAIVIVVRVIRKAADEALKERLSEEG
ncbi:MAG: TVP38/TMEM64 family protein [Woeseiaceae bacterium]|nr:TVP38/TMEM64 family protein [Woeseiaceae bacterium]